ncbi:hypothetical protein STEG23_015525, partial [Scotinomys teguina]
MSCRDLASTDLNPIETYCKDWRALEASCFLSWKMLYNDWETDQSPHVRTKAHNKVGYLHT